MHVYHTHIEALVLVLVLCMSLSDKHMFKSDRCTMEPHYKRQEGVWCNC